MFLHQIAKVIEGQLIGDGDCEIKTVSSIDSAKKESLTFVLNVQAISKIENSLASAFVTFKELPNIKNQIVVKNPKKALALIIDLFSEKNDHAKKSVSDMAVLSESSQISSSVSIGPFCVVGEKTCIGSHTQIEAHVVIGKNCDVGKNCKIYSNVVLYDHTKIGDNVIVHAGAKIGSDGFGYYMEGTGWKKIKHIGDVIIGDDVEIGANVCIDRGCLGATCIGAGTKIDNLVHIAHNTVIGKDCVITGQVGFVGSASIGDRVVIGGQAGIAAVEVGNDVTIAAKAGVTKNFGDKVVLSGFPAWDHRLEIKKEALIRKLVKK
jgi:UDP-3-O-[3-hydroxymyristoyl] glucosamine N-acyltransferase